MSKNITIADIADALGVSKSTVSRAISGKGRIGQETKEKVFEYIDKYGYRANVVARGLAQSKTYNICVVLPADYRVSDLTFFQECIMGIHNVSGIMEYDIVLCICTDNDISSLKRIIENGKADGVILMRTFVKDAQIEYLQREKVPFVAIGTTNYRNVVQVDNDHTNACKELTATILGKGMKKIALIGGNGNHVVSECRFKGFVEAHEEMNVNIDKSLLFIDEEDDASIDKNVENIIKNKADCIMCMDDAVCSVVIRKLRELKIKIPRDIRIASFYNSNVLENNVPAITSLSFDDSELGRMACKALLDILEGKEVTSRKLLSYEVVLKESTK